MSVKQAILDFTDGEIRNRIFVTPDIPVKKLNAARSQFVTRDDEVIVLYDDTVFGSGKDGIAITENYIYAKQLWEIPKSIKISSIRSITSQSKALNNLEIYINNNHFMTVSSSDKADHEFLVGILKAAKDAVATTKKKTEKAAPAEQTPSPAPARSAPKPKPRSAAKDEALSCDECSAVLPKDAKFCLECGTKVLPKGVCLECNAKLPEKARFCPECGTPAGRALPEPAEPKADTAGPSMSQSKGGTRLPSVNSALQKLAEKTEASLTASGRLARYFRDCENLFTSIGIEHGPGSLLKVSIVVETDGQADDLEEAEEAIGDYIFDAFLTTGLIEIFGEEGYEGLEFENHFKVKSLEDSNDSRGDHPTDYPLDQLLSDPSVQETLQAVEDKLLERGTLLSLLSGDDPEVSINFEFINPYNMDENSLFIVINVSDEYTDPDDMDDDDAEAVGDFVYSKISEMSGGFSKKSKEEFEGIEGTILRVNGIFKG